jgi:acetylornithine deacetylase/succinyl-diaminopimelate desuccinylase-like protein
MKGPICACLSAAEALAASGGLPVNLRFLLEGEEEVGSPHLESFVTTRRDALTAEVCLNVDAGMLAAGIPSITYGLRGIAYFELRVRGPKHDLHSGQFGGAVHNPAIVLAELIAGMHDRAGRVTLPGFYSRVRPLEADERAELGRLPGGDAEVLEQTGVPALYGEKGYTVVERTGARPTLDVNGLLSGFTGEGSKTILPAAAMAKISMRLVPDQDPKEVKEQLEQYLRDKAPPTVAWELKDLAGADPAITRRDSPAVTAMKAAMQAAWGREPVFERSGGTIPVVAALQKRLGMESLLVGSSLPDDAMHSPNEKLHLPTWHRFIETLVHFFCNLG